MYFKRVANSINRPHFLAERDGEVLLLNFCQDHRSMRSRTIEYTAQELSEGVGAFGSSTFDIDDSRVYLPAQTRGSRRTENFALNGHSKHGLGAHDGKVYFLDDSSRSETMSVWRVDAVTGLNEFTKAPSGFLTRFSDSEYFLIGSRSKDAAIYLWKTGEDAELIKKVKLPGHVIDRTRLAHGSKVLFLKVEGNRILLTSLDVITNDVAEKVITLGHIGDPTMRWVAAKNNLIAVISGRVVFVDIHTLVHEISPTNLDPSDKYHPFAVDSLGFVYILCPTTDGCTVQRARDNTFSDVVESKTIIPKDERVKAYKKELSMPNDQYISINFIIKYRGRTLLNQPFRMLTTKPIGDVIRRSPEIEQPPNTRVKLFYKNEEHLTFRTPNFLRIIDGDTIHVEFVDPLRDSSESLNTMSVSRENVDVVSREARVIPESARENKKAPKTKEHRKKNTEEKRTFGPPIPQERVGSLLPPLVPSDYSRFSINNRGNSSTQENLFVPSSRAFRNDSHSSRPSTAGNYTQPSPHIPPVASKEELTAKLIKEINWLKKFVEGKTGENGNSTDELTLLKKKYARALMMMGRSELKK